LAKERTAIIKQSLDDQKKALNQGVQYPSSQGSSPQQSTLPEAAQKALKEGHITTFKNGQQWTLENGQPKQVK
jgi:hypothetical protein